MNDSNLLGFLRKYIVVYKRGVELSAGGVSNVYFNVKRLTAFPDIYDEIACRLSSMIPKKATCMAANGVGGDPLVSRVGYFSRLPFSNWREEPRLHGLQQQIEGYIPTAKDRIALIEDVVNTGKSTLKLAGAFPGIEIVGVHTVVQRENVTLPFPVRALYHGRQLLKAL